jgi:hypothetical protein
VVSIFPFVKMFKIVYIQMGVQFIYIFEYMKTAIRIANSKLCEN